MSDNKRKHPRFSCALETIYYSESGNSADDEERLYFPGTITNKSNHGIGLRVNYQHTANEIIWFEGLIEGGQPRPAKVCWVSNNDTDPDNSDFLMGVEFADEDKVLI